MSGAKDDGVKFTTHAPTPAPTPAPTLAEQSSGGISRSQSGRRRSMTQKYTQQVLAEQEHQHARHVTLVEYIAKVEKLTPEEAKAAKEKGEDDMSKIVDYGNGVPVRVRRYPKLPKRGDKDGDYGIPVSVSLLMKVEIEGALVFLLMFILSAPNLYDNMNRSALRMNCRIAGGTEAGYRVLTSPPGKWDQAEYDDVSSMLGGYRPEDCGWLGQKIRAFNATDVPTTYQSRTAIPARFYALYTGLGGCQEYKACDNKTLGSMCDHDLLPLGPQSKAQTIHEMLVYFPTGETAPKYCLGVDAGISYTSTASCFLIILLFLLFLVRIRYLSQYMARHDDESRVTPADFAVQLDGLDTSIPPGELKRQLQAEIEALTFTGEDNFFKGRIHHLEVGRECREEILTMEALKALDMEVDEWSHRKHFREERGESTAKEDKKLRSFVPKFEKLREDMKRLVEDPDKSTGQAYIAFNEEMDRNRFYILFHPNIRSKAVDDFLSKDVSVDDAEGGRSATKRAKKRACRKVPILTCASPEAKDKDIKASESSPASVIGELLRYLAGMQKDVEGLHVTSAPEPREVNWSALELTHEHERKMVFRGNLVIFALCIASLVSLLVARAAQFIFRESYEGDGLIKTSVGGVFTLGITVVTMIFNGLIRTATRKYVHWEGQDTHTEEQTSTFTKLSTGLTVNSVLVPLCVAWWTSSGTIGDQTWYEDGGVVSTMMILIVCQYLNDMQNIFHVGSFIKKHIVARFTFSPKKLKELWHPANFDIASSYAFCQVLFSLGCIYGPLYPIAYLVTAIGLFFKYFATRFGLRHWFGTPPTVDQEMMMVLRWRLGMISGISLIVQCAALANALPADSPQSGLLVFVGGTLLITIYTCVPLGYFKVFERFDQLGELDDVDTHCTFEEAYQEGLPMPHYVCPTLSTDFEDPEFRAAYDLVNERTIKTGAHGCLTNMQFYEAALTETAAKNTARILSDYGLNDPMTSPKTHANLLKGIEMSSSSAAAGATDPAPPQAEIAPARSATEVEPPTSAEAAVNVEFV